MEFNLTLPGGMGALAEFVDAFEALMFTRSSGPVQRQIVSSKVGPLTTITANLITAGADDSVPTTWLFVGRGKRLTVLVESSVTAAVLEGLWRELSAKALDRGSWTTHWQRRFYRYLGPPLSQPLFVRGSWYCLPVPETMSGHMVTERYVAIDVAVQALTTSHAMHIIRRRELHEEVAAVISVVLEVGLRTPATQRVWTYQLGEQGSKVSQLGYVSSTFPLNADGEPSIPDDESDLNSALRNVWTLMLRLAERDRQRFMRSLKAMRTGAILRADLGLTHAAAAHSAIAVEALTGEHSEKAFTQFLVRCVGPSLPEELRDRLPDQAQDYYRAVRHTYAHGQESYIEESDPYVRMEKVSVGSRVLDQITFPRIVGRAILEWLVDRTTRSPRP